MLETTVECILATFQTLQDRVDQYRTELKDRYHKFAFYNPLGLANIEDVYHGTDIDDQTTDSTDIRGCDESAHIIVFGFSSSIVGREWEGFSYKPKYLYNWDCNPSAIDGLMEMKVWLLSVYVKFDPFYSFVLITAENLRWHSGELKVTEIYNFNQDDLMTEDIFVLDFHSDIFVWVGQQVDSKNEMHALSIGEV
ncbi:hypothetical protein F0562_022265 [Nyssa sinensis]|uniref:Gelsolin-like domain-containing protein n=1 Tax=Nyssa sinensis TaxID=561372 RepID=A0A5J5BM88_9ASTE|nr:hypothetical protein F0562_022265 [Nyssa sinensis]